MVRNKTLSPGPIYPLRVVDGTVHDGLSERCGLVLSILPDGPASAPALKSQVVELRREIADIEARAPDELNFQLFISDARMSLDNLIWAINAGKLHRIVAVSIHLGRILECLRVLFHEHDTLAGKRIVATRKKAGPAAAKAKSENAKLRHADVIQEVEFQRKHREEKGLKFDSDLYRAAARVLKDKGIKFAPSSIGKISRRNASDAPFHPL